MFQQLVQRVTGQTSRTSPPSDDLGGAAAWACQPLVAKRRQPAWTRLTPSGAIGLVIILTTLVVGILAPVLAPYDPLAQDLRGRMRPPMSTDTRGNLHILGTDELGRDMLSRLIYGARVTLLVTLTAVPISAVLGGFLG